MFVGASSGKGVFAVLPMVILIALSLMSRGCSGHKNSLMAVTLYVDAMQFERSNEKEEAIERLLKAVELDPKFTPAYSLCGDIYQQMGDLVKSADAYELAVYHDPWSVKDFFNLGKVTQKLKQFSRAIKAYYRACELDPRHFDSHLNLARCYYEVEDYTNALEYGQRAKNIDPNNPEPDLLMGDAHGMKEEHERAISSYRRALELEGNKPHIMIPLAVSYIRIAKYQPARELLETVIAGEPGNAVACGTLGFVYLQQKEVENAVAIYQRIIETDADNWEAHKGLGVAYMLKAMKTQDPALTAKALEHWQVSLNLQPDQIKLKRLMVKCTARR